MPTEIDRQIQLLIRNLVEIKDSSGEFLLRLDDGRVIDTKGWNDWEWTHGIGLYGIYKYYEQTRDARCRQIMLDWFRDRFAAGPPTKNINTVAPFLTLACLHEESPNAGWLPYLDEWAEWVMNGLPRTEENGFQHIVFNSGNHQQLWDDTLMMSVLPLARIGRLLGRPHYVEEARRQFMVHVKYMVGNLSIHHSCSAHGRDRTLQAPARHRAASRESRHRRGFDWLALRATLGTRAIRPALRFTAPRTWILRHARDPSGPLAPVSTTSIRRAVLAGCAARPRRLPHWPRHPRDSCASCRRTARQPPRPRCVDNDPR